MSRWALLSGLLLFIALSALNIFMYAWHRIPDELDAFEVQGAVKAINRTEHLHSQRWRSPLTAHGDACTVLKSPM